MLCVYPVVYFFPVVLLLDSSCFLAIVRIRSTTLGSSTAVHLLHGPDLLPSGISGTVTVTLDLTTIFAMLVVLSIAMSRCLPLVYQASQIAMKTSNLFALSSKPLFGYVAALCSPSYSVASCRCSCRLYHVGAWISWDITISLI